MAKKARWVRGARAKQYRLDSEPTIAIGTVLTTIPGTITYPQPLEVGQEIKIARIINTPIGHRLRLSHTTRWVGKESLNISYSSEVVVDYTGHLSKSGDNSKSSKTKRKNSISPKKMGKGFKGCLRRGTKGVGRPRKAGRTERYTGMDKTQLKDLISGFTAGEKVTVTFLADLADRSGDYEVVETKTGRGKGGSKLVVLKATDGTTITTGTPDSVKILHMVTADGTVHGFQSESEVPRTYEMNVACGEELKEAMKDLVGTTGARISLKDSAGEFTEKEYTVTQAEQKRGRYGQVVYTLLSDSGRVQEFWSHRHSGIVSAKGFKVISVPTQDTNED